MKKFLSSVSYAWNGVRYALHSERNIRIHLVIFLLAIAAGWLLKISRTEFLLILGISSLTLSLEMVNTAIERLADKVSPVHDKQIGLVKDIMAGAVMVSGVFALIIGVAIFLEPVLGLFSK